MMQTGIGIQNPLFFMGVVEDNEDPRLESRVKVRAFGIHGTVDDIPTEDLPWATLIIGSHDTNFVVPPLNSFVFGFFVDGRDAQQPMILGLIPTKYEQIIDPSVTGWGAPLGDTIDRAAMSRRHEDFGQPTTSRLARAENLDETYNLALEVNRVKDIEIAGGGVVGHAPNGNINSWSQDELSSSGTENTVPLPAGANLYANEAHAAAIRAGVPPDLYFRLIQQESGWNPNAVSPVGAKGLTQIMPETAAQPGLGVRPITNLNDTNDQLRFGAEYLRALYDRTGSWDSALAAYNGGLGNVQKYGGVPPFAETQNYVKKIFGGWSSAGSPITGLSSRWDNISVDGAVQTADNFGSAAIPASYSDTPSGDKASTWEEPTSGYYAQYPYNRVIETPGGQVIELDSTQGAERIMIWHPNGSYVQMTPSTTTYKSSKDKYDMNERGYHLYVGGNNIITIEGNSHVLVKGNLIEEIRGNYTQIVHGSISMGAANQININGGAETQIRSARLDLESNVENLNLKVGKKIVLTSGGGLHLKGETVFIESTSDLNIKAGGSMFGESASEMNLKSGSGLKISASQVDLGASGVVYIDGSTVRLAEGSSAAAGANSAEEAESVEMVEPPAPELSNELPAVTEV